MKPKTKIQKEVARLSANLRPISATQIDWAYRHCVEHIGYRTKKGNIGSSRNPGAFVKIEDFKC